MRLLAIAVVACACACACAFASACVPRPPLGGPCGLAGDCPDGYACQGDVCVTVVAAEGEGEGEGEGGGEGEGEGEPELGLPPIAWSTTAVVDPDGADLVSVPLRATDRDQPAGTPLTFATVETDGVILSTVRPTARADVASVDASGIGTFTFRATDAAGNDTLGRVVVVRAPATSNRYTGMDQTFGDVDAFTDGVPTSTSTVFVPTGATVAASTDIELAALYVASGGTVDMAGNRLTVSELIVGGSVDDTGAPRGGVVNAAAIVVDVRLGGELAPDVVLEARSSVDVIADLPLVFLGSASLHTLLTVTDTLLVAGEVSANGEGALFEEQGELVVLGAARLADGATGVDWWTGGTATFFDDLEVGVDGAATAVPLHKVVLDGVANLTGTADLYDVEVRGRRTVVDTLVVGGDLTVVDSLSGRPVRVDGTASLLAGSSTSVSELTLGALQADPAAIFDVPLTVQQSDGALLPAPFAYRGLRIEASVGVVGDSLADSVEVAVLGALDLGATTLRAGSLTVTGALSSTGRIVVDRTITVNGRADDAFADVVVNEAGMFVGDVALRNATSCNLGGSWQLSGDGTLTSLLGLCEVDAVEITDGTWSVLGALRVGTLVVGGVLHVAGAATEIDADLVTFAPNADLDCDGNVRLVVAQCMSQGGLCDLPCVSLQ